MNLYIKIQFYSPGILILKLLRYTIIAKGATSFSRETRLLPIFPRFFPSLLPRIIKYRSHHRQLSATMEHAAPTCVARVESTRDTRATGGVLSVAGQTGSFPCDWLVDDGSRIFACSRRSASLFLHVWRLPAIDDRFAVVLIIATPHRYDETTIAPPPCALAQGERVARHRTRSINKRRATRAYSNVIMLSCCMRVSTFACEGL